MFAQGVSGEKVPTARWGDSERVPHLAKAFAVKRQNQMNGVWGNAKRYKDLKEVKNNGSPS